MGTPTTLFADSIPARKPASSARRPQFGKLYNCAHFVALMHVVPNPSIPVQCSLVVLKYIHNLGRGTDSTENKLLRESIDRAHVDSAFKEKMRRQFC